MDKVLKYKFWILSVLVLPMALAGFFIANGGLKADTEERINKIKGISAPNPNQPNETHAVVAKRLADQQERDNNQQLRELDAIQRRWFKWPKLILDGLERSPETGEIVYRGTNIPPKTMSSISVQYPDEYKNELVRAWLSVNPVVPSGLPYSETSKKKVFCPIEAVPFHTLTQTPKIEEIWDAQEDIWLLEMLFTAINTTNQAAANVHESAIREIMYLELFGGSGASTVVAVEGAAGGGEYMASGGVDYMESGGATGADTGAGIKFADGAIAYSPEMEYGSSASVGEVADGGGEYMGAADGGLFGGGATAGAKPLRYVGFNAEDPGPYRKRGFYLSVLIQEKKIPDFVVNLANLDPPILAGRWGFANNPYDTDHLLQASSQGGNFPGGFGGDYGDSGGGGGNLRRPPRPAFGGGAGPNYGDEFGGGGGGPGGAGGRLFAANDPRFPPLRPAQIAEIKTFEAAKLGKDLVQLEISGLITIFTPNVPPPTPEETAATEADAVEAAPAAVSPPVDPSAPANVPAASDPVTDSSTETAAEPVEPAAEPAVPADSGS